MSRKYFNNNDIFVKTSVHCLFLHLGAQLTSIPGWLAAIKAQNFRKHCPMIRLCFYLEFSLAVPVSK